MEAGDSEFFVVVIVFKVLLSRIDVIGSLMFSQLDGTARLQEIQDTFYPPSYLRSNIWKLWHFVDQKKPKK